MPASPTNLAISNAKPTSLSLSWTAPESDGGSPITGYIIEKKERLSNRWTQVTVSSIQETSFNITGLQEGTEFEFQVSAENKAGLSKPSASVTLKIQPPGAPDAPEIEKIDSKSAVLTWSAPESTGGSPITGYHLEKRETGKDRWVKVTRGAIRETTFEVKDLVKDAEYEFRVSAENKAGIGEPSQPSKRAVAKLPYGNNVL